MLPYEEKKKAVELCLRYGRKIAPVIHEPGYPDRHTPYDRMRGYDASGGVPNDLGGRGKYSGEQHGTPLCLIAS